MLDPVHTIIAAFAAAAVLCRTDPLLAQTGTPLLEGKAAFGDWRADSPGKRRLIRPEDLPAPDSEQSARNFVTNVHRTDAQKPIVPNGFEVNLFASGLMHPRLIRVAPNGDVFAAESQAGRIRVLRPNGGKSVEATVFTTGLYGPFGIAFYPPGGDPQWVYVGNTDAAAPPERIARA